MGQRRDFSGNLDHVRAEYHGSNYRGKDVDAGMEACLLLEYSRFFCAVKAGLILREIGKRPIFGGRGGDSATVCHGKGAWRSGDGTGWWFSVWLSSRQRQIAAGFLVVRPLGTGAAELPWCHPFSVVQVYCREAGTLKRGISNGFVDEIGVASYAVRAPLRLFRPQLNPLSFCGNV